MKTNRYLNDEHMRLYEWTGMPGAAAVAPRPASKRSHTWHASYGVLAVLTTLLILNGCDRTDTAQRSTADQVDQTAQAPSDRPLYDEAPGLDAGETAAPSAPATEAMGAQTPAAGAADAPAGSTSQP